VKHIRLYESSDEPTEITYYNPSRQNQKRWKNSAGELHRVDGPARIEYDLDGNLLAEVWHKNGLIHREDGSAYTFYYSDGSIESERWFYEGDLYRKDGPTIIRYYRTSGHLKSQEWYQIDRYHRLDGPAVIKYKPTGKIKSVEWYIDGKKLIGDELEAVDPNTSEERLIDLYLKDDDTSKLAYTNPNFPKYIKDWIDF